MARDPELSIKVKVDPQIDGEHLGIDIQNQIDKLNKLPKVKIDPDTKNFGKDLSKQISQNLRAVNRVLKTQLDRMSTNINSLNQVSQELFSGTDFSSNIQSQAEIVNSSLKTIEDHISTLSSMFEASNSTKLKLSGSFSSIEELDNLIVAVKSNLLSLFNDGPLNDDNEFSKTFTAALPSIKKLRDIIFDIEEISDNKTVLTKLGIDGKSLVNSRNNLELLSSLLDTIIDYNDIGDINGIFDELKSTENISKYFSAAISSLKELDTTLDNTSKKTTNIKKDTKIFDRSQLDEISNAYSEAIGNLISKQNALNRSKKITINLEDQLLQKTTETTAKIGEQVQNLKSIFSEVASSDIGKQLPAVSEYMKSKAELEASKNIESAKSLSLNINSSSAKEYEAALKGIKDRINELGKEGAFDGLNNNIDENERAFINAKEYIKDYASALDEVKSKGRDTRLPQQKTTGLNVSNIENYSQKVTAIKNDLYALKDTVFPAIYSDINRTYGHLFDDSIINAQSYIDKLNELPAAASSKALTKTQHSKKVETIDSTNIKNYAALLNGIQGAMNDMKTTIVPGFDKVLSENGKKIADIGGSLVNYVAVLKRGLTAVDQSEKNMADETAAKPSVVPTKNNAPVKKPTIQKTQDAKVTIDSNEVVVTGGPVDIPGKVELKDKDIKRPNPLNINGAVKIKASDIKIDDVEISKKKFDINGNLILKNAEIVDAVKEATKEATRKAQPKQSTAKTKNGLTDRDFERKSKELLTSLASIMKGKARVQNSLTTHTRKGQSEAAAEDSYYLSKLSRRERTTKGKLTKLYKGRGGRSAWQSSSIYHSATEDSEHIRNSRVAENSDKDKVAEEEKYIAALRQRSKIYKELAAARHKYGDDSEYVKSSQKELQNTLDIISQFESKVGSQYLQAMPERRKVFAENMSNFRKDRDYIRHKNTQIAARDQQKAIVATNKSVEKERIASEKEFLENLAK